MIPRPSTELAAFKSETTHQLTTFDFPRRSKTMSINRGHRVTLGAVTGHGYITQLWLTFPGWFWAHWSPDDPVSPSLLKTLILRITWDEETEPAILAPIGDFFGNGLCEVSNFTSKYFGMSSGGFYCKFPMPFSKGFKIELENHDPHIDTFVFANVLYQLTEAPLENVGYFHAEFRTGQNPGPDKVTVLEADGRGHFAGCIFSAQSPIKNYLSYLEAPEYIFIDDDWDVPRIVGTGMEDYFLGGWYFREGEFTGELHGVPAKDSFNSSITMYRAHEADAIHFQRRIRFEFVNPWQPDRLKPFSYSSVAFYYLDSPAGSGRPLPPVADLLCFRIRDRDHLSIP